MTFAPLRCQENFKKGSRRPRFLPGGHRLWPLWKAAGVTGAVQAGGWGRQSTVAWDTPGDLDLALWVANPVCVRSPRLVFRTDPACPPFAEPRAFLVLMPSED